METFSALLAICAGNWPVPGEFPAKVQWRGALMFSLICVWIIGWVNNREVGDLRRYRAHYDVIVMHRPHVVSSMRISENMTVSSGGFSISGVYHYVWAQPMRDDVICNVVSHWLRPYRIWSLRLHEKISHPVQLYLCDRRHHLYHFSELIQTVFQQKYTRQ